MHPTQLNLQELVLLQKRMGYEQKDAIFTSRNAGGRLSKAKGRGMEFDEVRLYQGGDDIRQIDWKVTARTGETHTKLYREERDRAVWICADFSKSMFFATKKQFKSVLAGYFSAYHMWLANAKKDRCGGIIFNESEQYILKPSSRKKGILHLLQKCVDLNNNPKIEQEKYDINTTLKELNALAKTGSLFVIISDFQKLNQQGFDQILLLARHNEVLLQWILDPFEESLPHKNINITDGKKIVSLFAASKKNRDYYHQPIINIKNNLVKLNKHPAIKAVISNTENVQNLPKSINES